MDEAVTMAELLCNRCNEPLLEALAGGAPALQEILDHGERSFSKIGCCAGGADGAPDRPPQNIL